MRVNVVVEDPGAERRVEVNVVNVPSMGPGLTLFPSFFPFHCWRTVLLS